MTSTAKNKLDSSSEALYRRTLKLMNDSRIPFMLGGAYALAHYTEFERHTRDLDLFCRRNDAVAVLEMLAKNDFKTEMLFPHWLGKAFSGEEYIDVIFCSGNALCEVDDEAFANAQDANVLGVEVKVLPVEDIIWSKAFIMERERFDGADIAHLLRECGARLDWNRLLKRFGDNWRVLLSHLIMFGFIYPGHRDQIPNWVLNSLTDRLQKEQEQPPASTGICQGTLLSRAQYLVDIDGWGYIDAREQPIGNMSQSEIARWTAAIDK